MYDVTIACDDVEGESPTFKHIVNGIPLRAQFFMRRIPMSQIPTDDDKKCSEFLYNLYQEKVNKTKLLFLKTTKIHFEG